jgi:hypothetical protein
MPKESCLELFWIFRFMNGLFSCGTLDWARCWLVETFANGSIIAL